MRVNCAIPNCPSEYVSDENPSPNGVRYICAHHTSKELRAAGIHVSQRTDKDVHFQTFAFDKDLEGRVGVSGGENAKRANQHWMHQLPEQPGLYRSALDTSEDE